MDKPRILYFIYSSSVNSGGGHFYSLNAISSVLCDAIDFKILNLGATFAKPLVGNPNANYIGLFKYNLFFKIISVLRFVKNFKPQTIHAFDHSSLFIARLIALLYPVTVIFTKCGGQNGSANIPDSDAQIFFSKENFEHYTKNGNTNIPKYLIPNRVNKVNIDNEHVENFKKEYSLNNKFILLRISRFNPYYDLTFKQSIALLNEYLKTDKNATLVLVGKIQSEEYFKNLQELIEGLPIILVTKDRFTNEASRLLNAADVIIATGRGVMEACSLDKIIYCPIKNKDLPILLNNSTVNKLLDMNFSERAVFESSKSVTFDGTKQYFENYFSVHNVKERYLDIYKSLHIKPFRFTNFIIHSIQFLKPKL